MKFKEIISKNIVTEKRLTELILSTGVTQPHATTQTSWCIFKVAHLKPAFQIASKLCYTHCDLGPFFQEKCKDYHFPLSSESAIEEMGLEAI